MGGMDRQKRKRPLWWLWIDGKDGPHHKHTDGYHHKETPPYSIPETTTLLLLRASLVRDYSSVEWQDPAPECCPTRRVGDARAPEEVCGERW